MDDMIGRYEETINVVYPSFMIYTISPIFQAVVKYLNFKSVMKILRKALKIFKNIALPYYGPFYLGQELNFY